MNISLSIFLFSILIYEISTKSGGRGGGGGGRGGGGRGSSGSRSAFSRSGSSGGGKYHSSSSHSNYINYDSSAFRSSVFKPSTSKTYFSTGTTTNTYVINQPATPIIYDNHYYYWHGHYHSHPEKKTYCEYAISEEDGELYNVTYGNGTRPKYLTFGCGSYEKCCGLSCCSSIGDWMALSIWFLIFFLACCYGSRNN